MLRLIAFVVTVALACKSTTPVHAAPVLGQAVSNGADYSNSLLSDVIGGSPSGSANAGLESQENPGNDVGAGVPRSGKRAAANEPGEPLSLAMLGIGLAAIAFLIKRQSIRR